MKTINNTPLIYDLSFEALSETMIRWGEPSFRVLQVWQGLYKELWHTPEEFTTLPKSLRARLSEEFRFHALTPAVVQESKDGQTVKTLFKLSGNFAIEAVLMRYERRRTLCISSQAGCAMGCVFCATGQMGFKRHLTSGEIVSQVLYYARELKSVSEKVTNVVVMGMGEPFHNYDETIAAIERLNHSEGYNLGARRFTISTVGLVPMIYRFADERKQINLAISLHASEDAVRDNLLPVNKKYNIDALLEACKYYVTSTGRRITFEWALIYEVNDSLEEAMRLANLLKGLLCHVNVIPLNPTSGYEGRSTPLDRAKLFRDTLVTAGIPCTIRARRGIDIQAGCGQLAAVSGE